MKKLLLTFLVLLFTANFTFAADECAIKSKPAQILEDYIQSTRTATGRARGNNSSPSSPNKSETTIKILNHAFSYDVYFSHFKYFAVYPLSNSIPEEIKRDYKSLKDLGDFIIRESENINPEAIIENFCQDSKQSGANGSCNVPDRIRADDLMAMIMKNNENILAIYRNVVMGDAMLQEFPLLFVEEDFLKKLEENYSPAAYAPCYNEHKKDLKEKMDEIINWHNKAVFGSGAVSGSESDTNNLQTWINKWAELVGKGESIATQRTLDTQKENLVKELPKYGIYRNSQQNLLTALDKYKQYGLFRNTNFAYNTYSGITNLFWRKFRERVDDNLPEFYEKAKKDSNGYISNSAIITAEKNSAKTIEVGERINETYLELMNFEANAEQTTSTLIQRVIKIHKDIADSIDILARSCQDAVNMCQQQDPTRGDCGKCN